MQIYCLKLQNILFQVMKSVLRGIALRLSLIHISLIAGHDSTYFASLENINEGNYLIFTKDSKQYLYKVRMTEIRKASDGFDLKKDGDQELVLYTCYPFGVSSISREKRFFVYCDFISESKEESVNE